MSKNPLEDLMEMATQLQDDDSIALAQHLAINHGVKVPGGRPPIPDTMLGLETGVNVGKNNGLMLAVGNPYNDTGFSEDGLMTFVINDEDRPFGHVGLSREQCAQLRDYLTSKLEK